MKKEKDNFNPAFENLPSMLKKAQKNRQKAVREPPKRDHPGRDEKDIFMEAVSDVTPLPQEKKRRSRDTPANIRPVHPAPDDEQEVMSHLYGLVRGSIEMDITFSDEYMEGSVRGVGRKLIKTLKRGELPVQDYIDLHGLTKDEARTEVTDFLVKSHKSGLRCVLIVHGRGLNSPDSFPVLKEGLPLWLGSGPARKIVLAFATARPYDGGTGAIYVLLRKR